MKRAPTRKYIALLLSICPIVLVSLISFAAPAFAQSPDSEPPVLSVDVVEEAGKGEAQKFTVTATDNVGVQSIEFNYRLDSGDEFTSGLMSRIDQSDIYTFNLQSDDIAASVDTIEYYIEAVDEAGNKSLQGFFFDPLQRVLVDNPGIAASDDQSLQAESTSLLDSLSTTQKVLYGALGVVVVGALISAAGSGSDSEPRQLVNVTIVHSDE